MGFLVGNVLWRAVSATCLEGVGTNFSRRRRMSLEPSHGFVPRMSHAHGTSRTKHARAHAASDRCCVCRAAGGSAVVSPWLRCCLRSVSRSLLCLWRGGRCKRSRVGEALVQPWRCHRWGRFCGDDDGEDSRVHIPTAPAVPLRQYDRSLHSLEIPFDRVSFISGTPVGATKKKCSAIADCDLQTKSQRVGHWLQDTKRRG